jgi:hypothetical protein
MFFTYYGFDWIHPLSESGMYVVFALMLIACVGILLGAFYRLSAVTFFLLFTYVELIDKTNYLNHYYFVSLISFIIIFLPANRHFALDGLIFRKPRLNFIPRFYVLILQLQMFIVYFFAGIAKINHDWLIEAQPLKIWLPAFSHYPLIGPLMEKAWLAYFFSWFACIYDLSIGFLLFNKRSVRYAYLLVIIFHLFTAAFFNIGMFPYIMMTITIIFFGEQFHIKLLTKLKQFFNYHQGEASSEHQHKIKQFLIFIFGLYFCIQLLMPFRYLLYEGRLFWTEQGYRFSWRVMLMEKAGTAFFYIQDKQTKKEIEIDNRQYLTYMQEKMMATQPDMMVDYAHYLKKVFEGRGFQNFAVKAQSYVTVNGSGTREFIDPNVDLSLQDNCFLKNKRWIRSYE